MLKKIWNWAKVAIGIVFVILVYMFLTRSKISKSEIKKKIDEVIKLAKIEEEKVKKVAKRVTERAKQTRIRKEEAKELSEKLGKYFKK